MFCPETGFGRGVARMHLAGCPFWTSEPGWMWKDDTFFFSISEFDLEFDQEKVKELGHLSHLTLALFVRVQTTSYFLVTLVLWLKLVCALAKRVSFHSSQCSQTSHSRIWNTLLVVGSLVLLDLSRMTWLQT